MGSTFSLGATENPVLPPFAFLMTFSCSDIPSGQAANQLLVHQTRVYNQASKHRKAVKSGPLPIFCSNQEAKEIGKQTG